MNLPTFETITRDEALAFILSGLEAKRAKVDATLRDLRSQLEMDATNRRRLAALNQLTVAQMHASAAHHANLVAAASKPKRRKMSAATRKRMAAAQRARWAKVRG